MEPSPNATVTDKKLVDRVVYLSSLVSRRDDVDPLMDSLRIVTSTWDGSRPLDDSKKRELSELEQQLTSYLTTKDPVRTFTQEDLDERLAEQLGERVTNTSYRRYLWYVVGSSILAGVLAFGIPLPNLALEYRILMAISVFFTALHVWISWLYLSTLKNFKQEIRRAYIVICIGIVLFSLTFSHYAVIGAFDLAQYQIFRYAGITWLVAAPFMFMYFGLRLYAKQLGLQSWAVKLPVVLTVWVGAMAVVILAPHAPTQSEFYFDLLIPGGISMPVFSLLGAVLANKIRKAVTLSYSRPMTWMYRYLALTVFTSFSATMAALALGELQGSSLYTLMAVFGIPVQLLLMYTGYSFKKELSSK